MSLRNAHKGASTDAGARSQVDYRDLNFLDSAWILGSAFKLEQKRQSLGGEHRASLAPSYSWTLRDVDHLLYPTRVHFSVGFSF
jgi:hypothetical protein